MRSRTIVTVVLAGLLWMALPSAVLAAESYDSCKGYITAVPARITTPGTWCLKQSLSSLASTGSAITIAARDVTLDCNGFTLDNSVVGSGTSAIAVRAANVPNVTVRHCSIHGFRYGIFVSGTPGGHLVEDNHLDSNTYTGIRLQGEGSIVRRNVIVDTGGSSVTTQAYGIYTTYPVDILDNTVAGVFADAGDTFGIRTDLNASGMASDNRVRNVVSAASNMAYGIVNYNSGRMTVSGNTVSGNGNASTIGISCSGPSDRAKNNVVAGFATAFSQCGDAGGNDSAP